MTIPELKKVDGLNQLQNPGDFCFYRNYGGKVVGIIMICLCGQRIQAGDRHRIVSEDPLTIAPQMVHSEMHCQFFITDGKIILP